MNIAVLIKQTFDTEAIIRLNDNGQIIEEELKYIINPYDEYAIEEAVRAKEKDGSNEVVVISAGGDKVQEALRQALAMGADRAVLVNDPALVNASYHDIALALSQAIQAEKCDLILTGCVDIDDNASQVPARIAEILKIPQMTVVTKLTLADNAVTCQREGDGLADVIEGNLPVIITAQKGLNEPRYQSFKEIMAAKKKPIKTYSLAQLGMTPDQMQPGSQAFWFELPAKRQAGKVLEGDAAQAVKQLVSLLQNEIKVI